MEVDMTRTVAAVAGAVLIALATVELVPAARGDDGQQRARGDPDRRYAAGSPSAAVHGRVRSTVAPAAYPEASGAGAAPIWGGCRVRYAANTWNNGFTANVTINNTGTTPVRGWSLRWAWPGKQQLASVWNATVTQNGTQVIARNASWNWAIAPGGSVKFGFQGTYGRTNAAPTWFALNGTSCVTG
jgi:hypothetical protein